MTKKFEFDWHIPVPEPLLTGCVCDRWTEEKDSTELEQRALFRVDEYGFFIYWKSEGREGDVIELCQVSDVRAGGLPKDQKLYTSLVNKHGQDVEDKSLTICSGTDYININYQHIVCPNAETAKVWLDGLRKITHNVKANNFCPMTC
jgi:phosphatidylinositol phospholipase C beta